MLSDWLFFPLPDTGRDYWNVVMRWVEKFTTCFCIRFHSRWFLQSLGKYSTNIRDLEHMSGYWGQIKSTFFQYNYWDYIRARSFLVTIFWRFFLYVLASEFDFEYNIWNRINKLGKHLLMDLAENLKRKTLQIIELFEGVNKPSSVIRRKNFFVKFWEICYTSD